MVAALRALIQGSSNTANSTINANAGQLLGISLLVAGGTVNATNPTLTSLTVVLVV